MKKWIFNPFKYIAGVQSLLIGVGFITLTLIISFYSNMHFDGTIDAHIAGHQYFIVCIIEQLIAWACPLLVFYGLAFVLSSSKFRFVDIAGTIALARGPMLLVAFLAFIPILQYIKPGHVNYTVLIGLSILMLIPVIWMIALMYNAFVISFNLKGTKAVGGFIAGLILAEVLSLILNHYLQQYHSLIQNFI